MFTGIVERVGQITGMRRAAGAFTINIDAHDLTLTMKPGDSLAVDGICLTAAEITGTIITVHASTTTQKLTTLSSWRAGRDVNLERALALGDRVGGHLVSGHVDTTARVQKLIRYVNTALLTLIVPDKCQQFLADRGSAAINGVSLTIAHTRGRTCTFILIPETLARTTLGRLRPGHEINIEVDVLARYGQIRLQRSDSLA